LSDRFEADVPMARHTPYALALGVLTVALAAAQPPGQQPGEKGGQPKHAAPAPPATILRAAASPIDLTTALKLAGAENPELQIARQRVAEATAFRQLAAAQVLPNINLGGNYNLHRGVLQQDNGNILRVDRDALYVGLGANAVGAGTVNIPGLNYNVNVGSAWYGFLAARQNLTTARWGAAATDNDVQLRVSLAYLDLVRAKGRRAIATLNREEAAELARITEAFAKAGQGRKADADRAAVELRRRDADLTQAEADALTASARLCQLLNLDPATRLHPVEGWAVPEAIIPEPVTLPELLATALMRRPELAARRSEVQQALYQLSLAKVLPFSPNVVLGFSAGGFGGGSDLVSSPQGFVGGDGERVVAPRFGDLKGRADFDVVVFWTFRNMGVGNLAQIRAADSQVKQLKFRELETLNLVRAQVAEAHARTTARVLQIDAAEKAVRSSTDAYKEDFTRIKGGQGLPLEAIDSLRLLGRSRYEYLEAIIDYNRAQFQLWTALGNPPADALSRPTPARLLPREPLPGPRVLPMPRLLPGLPAKP
jgi:outer membrane protein TolC